VVVPDEVVLVGRIHPVAQQRHAVALGEFSGALEEGEPLVDVAAVGAADAGDVRGDRRVPRRLIFVATARARSAVSTASSRRRRS
jgi:hypothetical protein